jgi:hypothetical protein
VCCTATRFIRHGSNLTGSLSGTCTAVPIPGLLHSILWLQFITEPTMCTSELQNQPCATSDSLSAALLHATMHAQHTAA